MGGDLRARWLRGAACAVSLALASGQEPQQPDEMSPADKVRAEIDRLIEEVEELDAFVAEYEGRVPEGPIRLMIEYRAPDSMRIAMSDPEDGDREFVIADGCMYAPAADDSPEGESKCWRIDFGTAFELRRDELLAALQSNAGRLASVIESRVASATYGPQVNLTLGAKPKGGESVLPFSLDFRCVRQTCSPFHWLCSLRKRADKVALASDSITLERDGGVLVVSTSNGFVTSCTTRSGDSESEIRLVRLLRDEEIPAEDIAPPEEYSAPSKEFATFMRAAAVADACALVRNSVEREVESDRIEWDADAGEDFARALRDFFVDPIEQCDDDCIAAMHEWIDARAESLKSWEREALEGGADADEVRMQLRRAVEESRETMSQSLVKWRDRELDRMLMAVFEPEDGLPTELRDLERDAANDAWDDVVSTSVTAYFDEQLVEPWAD